MHLLITGASSGIGAAIATEFANLPDVRITLVARRLGQLTELADKLEAGFGCRTHVAVVDLAADATEPPGEMSWLEDAISKFGPVDTLVNNAGVQVIGPTAEIDVAAGERSVFLNLLVPLRLTRAVLPAMVSNRRGTIVNITSMAAIAPTPSMTYYNASKAGLAAASEALGGELRGTGVSVLTVYPGIIGETDLAQRALWTYKPSRLLAMQPQASASSLARQIRRSAERKRKRLIYPRANVVARWFPSTSRWLMDRFTPALRSQSASAPRAADPKSSPEAKRDRLSVTSSARQERSA